MIREFQPECVPLTANATLDVTAYRSGTVFTNRGAAGAVTLTLPTLSNIRKWRGYTVLFNGIADQTIKLQAAAGKGIGLNNAACASIAAQTAGQKIGTVLKAVWDGSSWLFAGWGGTTTIA